MAKKYPIGIQDFEKLRKEGYYYIDKTSYVYDLVEKGNYYFLSRPRRFGKSLLISTIEAYFEGKKNLFDGLAISGLEKDWKKYPVLHLDLNTQRYETENSLLSLLEENVVGWEEKYGRNAAEVGIERRFAGVIRRAHEMTGERTVILVDEYDKPLLQTIDDEHLQDAYRTLLKAFYGALKSEDAHIRFAMLTGVTKFGKVSVFSDLNNLQDISMDERYADICGISEAELSENFSEDIRNLAEANGQSLEEASIALKERYDGYHFNPWTSYGLYNPFSLLNTFAKNRYRSYWFETGTPTSLIRLLKDSKYDLTNIKNNDIFTDSLYAPYDESHPLSALYQSGYLTIKDYDPEFRIYKLGFPNNDVRDSFMGFLQSYYTLAQDTLIHG